MKIKEWFENNWFTLLVTLIIIGFAFWVFYPFIPIPSGSVKGNLVSYEVHPMGWMCGDYAWTKVILKNVSCNGDKWFCSGNTFYFDDEYRDVEDLTIGNYYEFVYKKGSRPSDTTSGDMVEQYYLLWIN